MTGSWCFQAGPGNYYMKRDARALEGRWIEFAADLGTIGKSTLGEKDFNIHLQSFFDISFWFSWHRGYNMAVAGLHIVVCYLSLPIISCGFRSIFFGVVLCPIPLNASISESTLYWWGCLVCRTDVLTSPRRGRVRLHRLHLWDKPTNYYIRNQLWEPNLKAGLYVRLQKGYIETHKAHTTVQTGVSVRLKMTVANPQWKQPKLSVKENSRN